MGRWPLILLTAVLVGCEEPASPPEASPPRQRDQAKDRPLAPAEVAPFSMSQPDVVLLATGSTHGRLEVCNCTGPMAGGLSRRSGLVESYRAAFGNVVLADTGNAFRIEPSDLANRYVLRAYRELGYDAMVLGDHEWAGLAGPLGVSLRAVPMNYLSTNASARGEALPIVPAFRRSFGACKLALISYLSPEVLHFLPHASYQKLVLTGAEAVGRLADQLKGDGHVVVLLARTSEEELTGLADLKSVDLIVRGYGTQSEGELLRVGSIPVVKVGGPEYVAAVAMSIDRARIVEIDFRLEAVDTRWPLDAKLMSVYQAYAHEAMRQALDAERKAGLKYVPSSDCGRCHRAQFEAWRKGPHARAWETLVTAKRTYDPNCMMCHTSGFGTVHGFRTIRQTPKLSGVNCQDCHRIDADPRMDGRVRPKPVGQETCAICHTAYNSPKFDFQKYRPHIGCARAKAAKTPQP